MELIENILTVISALLTMAAGTYLVCLLLWVFTAALIYLWEVYKPSKKVWTVIALDNGTTVSIKVDEDWVKAVKSGMESQK